MKAQSTFSLAASIFLTICSASSPSFAQSSKPAVTPNQENSVVQSSRAPNNATEFLALEINYLRQSLQILNAGLREIGDKVATGGKTANSKQNRIITNFDLLSRAEQRAEALRKQLIELVEKETSIKARVIGLEEDARQENIERTIPTLGSTRAPEIRENRRKSLETERAGLQGLITRIEQSRTRLEEDVRQADLVVVSLRQRLLPLIEREIQNINPE
jgi:hypothetical protein